MKVLFFARARDLAEVAEVELDIAESLRVDALRVILAERYPRLAGLLPHCAIAVNDTYADGKAVLTGTDIVAVLPPVSGGSLDDAPTANSECRTEWNQLFLSFVGSRQASQSPSTGR